MSYKENYLYQCQKTNLWQMQPPLLNSHHDLPFLQYLFTMSQLFALVVPGIQRSKKAVISRRADVKKASIELKMRHGCMGKWESGS